LEGDGTITEGNSIITSITLPSDIKATSLIWPKIPVMISGKKGFCGYDEGENINAGETKTFTPGTVYGFKFVKV
jgi:hypothetical protein